MLRVFEDPDDRLGTVVQINCLADRQAGVLVGHAAPRGLGAALPQDLLLALGHRDSARNWPGSSAAAWVLARAWMAGFQIGQLVVYGAWRLTDKLAATLSEIASVDGIDVSVVNLATMRPRLPCALAGLPVEPVTTLVDGAARSSRSTDRTVPRLPTPLPAGLPPLPPADFTCFRSECMGCIEGVGLWLLFRRAFDSLIDAALRRLGDADSPERVLDVLEEQLRQARDSNELLAGVRAFQVAALRSGWHVQIPLRDAALAIAMALNTATADHEWPLASDARPQPQALAALAWATRRSAAELSAVTIGDIDPRCETCAGQRIDPTMRPPIRAQIWMQRHRARSDRDPLFCTSNGRRLRAHAIQVVLDSTAPTAFNTTELGPGTVRRSLAQIVDITRVATDPAEFDWSDERPWALLPSARYADWAIANGGSDFLERTGLPRGYELLANNGRGFAQAVSAATGFPSPPHWPRSDRSPTSRQRRTREHDRADAARLHSVLLQTGWGADRLSLIHGLDWSAERLHTAERTLREQLRGTAEILASTLDGRLELRVRSDDETAPAVQKILKRDHGDRGLSPTGARLLLELLGRPQHGVSLDDIQMPRDIAQAAIEELRQRRLIDIANHAWISLAQGVRSNLAGWEREPMPATHDCR